LERSRFRALQKNKIPFRQRFNPLKWNWNPFKWQKSSWKKLFSIAGVTFAVLILVVSGLFAYYVRDLPNPKQLTARPVIQSTKIVDRNGQPLYSFYGEYNRTVVKGNQISDYVKNATIAVEDATFYQNHGFDLKGIMRAVYDKITHRGLGGGGSTITQQYIKNALLTSDQTLDRKLRELILAIEVDQLYTKDEILTGYLNEIPYGSNSYGIEAAAQTYFSKSAKELTLSEAATLAAIPQAPTYYSPYGSHLDDLFTRKDYILDRMTELKFITADQAKEAKAATPNLANPTFKHTDLKAPHFVFYVREQLIRQIASEQNVSDQDAEKRLDDAGYIVTTSLDLPTQEMGEKILADMGPNTVKTWGATNASLTAVDPKTGEVLAMVGSIDYSNSKNGNVNYATALKQPGSTFKPIVYATAFGPSFKYAPSSITFDLETNFGNYTPHDYDGKWRGPVTNRQALAGSLNIPAVKNFYLAGISNSIQTAQKLGITTLTRSASDYGLSLVLGSGEVKEVEMANAFATFANGGMHNPLRPILKIQKDGQTIKDFTTTEATKAVEPEVAYEISSILSDNTARSYIFGVKNNLVLSDRPVAAKSGTTENNRDAWTIGYTPSIAVAVWVGNDDNGKTMKKGADGSYVAAPIWNKFMTTYLKGKPVEQFTRPATIKDVTVDKLSGKLPTDQSPADQHITDIFAPWQVPTENDDVHIKVKIDKVSGKLATDLTPASTIEERYYLNIHSEAPDLPNWEAPVQAWAKQNGWVGAPPTEKDDIHTADNAPTLTFVSPTGSSVSGEFTIQATPGGPRAITQVEYFLNSVSIGKVTSAPWSITYNASNLGTGTQIITATATNDIGLTKTVEVDISVNQDTTPPSPVSNITETDGMLLGNKPISLGWTNPSNSDLASVKVYLSTKSGSIGTLLDTLPEVPNTAGSYNIAVANLTAGTYYVTLHTVDTHGNENQSTNQTVVKVHP
jgi:membrane peptidoglycan carboxypeptidase